MHLANAPAYILSVDVEDWFHILDLEGAPPLESWSSLPSRVEGNVFKILDLLSAYRVTSTMFFLGWIAERFPHLVREAQARGHEIGSHSYAHRLVYTMTPEEFAADTRRARMILQDISGEPVAGYRAPGFSVTAATPWFFERLAAAGHTYDCSVFPAPRSHGGLPDAECAPYVAVAAGGSGKPLIELPMSVAPVLGRRICFFGGGYMRLFPFSVIRTMAERVHAKGRPIIFYLHPRDIDPQQPRLPMPMLRSFKCYVNVKSNFAKLEKLLKTFSFISVGDYLASLTSAAPRHPETAAVLQAE